MSLIISFRYTELYLHPPQGLGSGGLGFPISAAEKVGFAGKGIFRNIRISIQRGFRHFELTRADLDPKGTNGFMPALNSNEGGLS
jgi:hypothetical protein